jgi:hypothetical protein
MLRRLPAFIKSNHEVIIAGLALIVSVVAFHLQREHNFRSLRPLPSVNRLNFDNRVGVELENRGLGPMIIREVRVASKVGRGNCLRRSRAGWYAPSFSSLMG